MPTTDPLFSKEDLAAWLRQPVSDDAADVVERVVWGQVRPLLKLDVRPSPASDELKSWAIELGAIAYANPEGLSLYALEAEKSEYSSERRDKLLRAVAGGGVTAPGVALAAKGSFPPARAYPDAIERYPDRV